MVFVERELAAVDPGAEAEVASQYEEETGKDAADNSADVGARGAVFRGLCSRGCAASFSHHSAVGARDSVGALDGVGDSLPRGEWAGGGSYDRGSDGGAAGRTTAYDGLDCAGDLVAEGAGEALCVFLLGLLLILRILGWGAA